MRLAAIFLHEPKLQGDAHKPAEGRKSGKCRFWAYQTGIDLGRHQDTPVGKDDDALPRFGFQFVQKATHTLKLLHERFTAGDGRMDMVSIPGLQMRVGNVVEKHHLPFSEIELEESTVPHRISVTTESRQPRAAGEWTRVGAINGTASNQFGLCAGGFRLERFFKRHIGLPIAGPHRDIHGGMTDEYDFHNNTKIQEKTDCFLYL